MASKTPSWATSGKEIAGDVIGQGFVKWDKPGEHLKGRLIRRWQTARMKTEALVIQLDEGPSVAVFDTSEDQEQVALAPTAGDMVNLSLSKDLESKLVDVPDGLQVGIIYMEDVPTQSGPMRKFKVLQFGVSELKAGT